MELAPGHLFKLGSPSLSTHFTISSTPIQENFLRFRFSPGLPQKQRLFVRQKNKQNSKDGPP